MPRSESYLTLPDNSPVAHTYAEVSSLLHDIVKGNNGKPPSPEQVKFMLKQLERLTSTGDSEKEMSLRLAREVIGNENFFGPAEIKKTLGIEISNDQIPPIPFSTEELRLAKEKGQYLILRWDIATQSDGSMSFINLRYLFRFLTSQYQVDDLISSLQDKYNYVATPRRGWALCGEPIPVPDTDNNREFYKWFVEMLGDLKLEELEKFDLDVSNQLFTQENGPLIMDYPVLRRFVPRLVEVIYDKAVLPASRKTSNNLMTSSFFFNKTMGTTVYPYVCDFKDDNSQQLTQPRVLNYDILPSLDSFSMHKVFLSINKFGNVRV